MVQTAKNCAGGPGSDGSDTTSWSVNAACHIVLTGQGKEAGDKAEWSVVFHGTNEFTVTEHAGSTYFRK